MNNISEILMAIISIPVAILSIYSVFNDIKNNKDFESAIKHFYNKANPLSKKGENYLNSIEIVINGTFPFFKINKWLFIYLHFTSISVITTLFFEPNNKHPENQTSNTIVGMMLLEKINKALNIQVFLLSCLSFHILLVCFSVVNFSSFLLAIILIGIFSIHIDQKLINYRIQKGWYGKNEFEAKEIINYIISHSNKDDFNDSGGLKKVIPLPKIEENKEKISEQNHGGVTT